MPPLSPKPSTNASNEGPCTVPTRSASVCPPRTAPSQIAPSLREVGSADSADHRGRRAGAEPLQLASRSPDPAAGLRRGWQRPRRQQAGATSQSSPSSMVPNQHQTPHFLPTFHRGPGSASREWFRLAIGDAGDLVIYVRAGLLPAAGDLQNAITVLGALAATLSSGARQVEGELLPRDQTPRLERG